TVPLIVTVAADSLSPERHQVIPGRARTASGRRGHARPGVRVRVGARPVGLVEPGTLEDLGFGVVGQSAEVALPLLLVHRLAPLVVGDGSGTTVGSPCVRVVVPRRDTERQRKTMEGSDRLGLPATTRTGAPRSDADGPRG